MGVRKLIESRKAAFVCSLIKLSILFILYKIYFGYDTGDVVTFAEHAVAMGSVCSPVIMALF